MIKAIIFDMDGVLVDSEPLSIQVGIDFFASKGVKVNEEDFAPFLGGGEKLFFFGPAKKHDLELDYAEVNKYFNEHYAALLKKVDIVFDNAQNLLKELKGYGFKVAIASSATEEKVRLHIKALGVSESFFDALTTVKDVEKNKPDPEIYLKTAQKLGLKPEECLVFEDSVNGVKSAKNAGMTVVGLMTTVNAEVIAQAGADYIISSLAAIPKFNTSEEFMSFLVEDERDDRVRYGANLILPVKLKFTEKMVTDRMVELAREVREHAYAPFSHFKVGAALLSAATGRIYTGCNVENSSFGATICAERNAVLHAIAEEGVIGVERLVVVTQSNPPSPPCAMCLQVLAEFTKADTPVILVDLEGNRTEYKFSDLLPNPFYLKQV